jgi:uncharacterized protein (DUF433 family)
LRWPCSGVVVGGAGLLLNHFLPRIRCGSHSAGAFGSDAVNSFAVQYRRAVEPNRKKTRAMQIERITHNPAVMGGKPCIRGLRVTVETILGLLASGKSRERILQAYPYLEPEDIDAALAYAAWRLEEREEPLVVT